MQVYIPVVLVRDCAKNNTAMIVVGQEDKETMGGNRGKVFINVSVERVKTESVAIESEVDNNSNRTV